MRDNEQLNGIIEDITVTYVSGFLKFVYAPVLPLLISAVLPVYAHPGEPGNSPSEYAGSLACKTFHGAVRARAFRYKPLVHNSGLWITDVFFKESAEKKCSDL